MNLEQLKAKYNKGNETTTVKGEATTTATLGMSKAGQRVNKAWGVTKDVTKAAATTVGRVMPATNGKVDDLAAKFNNRLNNVEMEQRVQEVWIKQISQMTGVNLADREEIIEALLEEDKAAEEAKQAEQAVEAVAPMMEKMMEMFQSMFGEAVEAAAKPKKKFYRPGKKAEIEPEEVEEIEDTELPEEEEQEPEVQQEAPKGRRRIKRGAPLAD